MDLLNKIIECTDEELEKVVEEVLNDAIKNSEKTEILGFGEDQKRIFVHKGFISPETRISYMQGTMYNYSMRTSDYIYEFAKYIKDNNIRSRSHLVKSIENFINIYFGIKSNSNGERFDYRNNYFSSLVSDTGTDEELFDKIDNFEIGDLKGKNIAMCTEISAVAQNLLSLFGIDTYYCIGYVMHGEKGEPHCFNIARAKETFKLLDYSKPCAVVSGNRVCDWAPFEVEINLNEVEDIIVNGTSKTFDDYEWLITKSGRSQVPTNDPRTYIVGKFSLEQKQTKGK